ncbi:hypothetical protein MED222_06355 [Vibrio sp. MED222]|nr:hypothetical protein MED222_06355 [Vibrio sp. MED222]
MATDFVDFYFAFECLSVFHFPHIELISFRARF